MRLDYLEPVRVINEALLRAYGPHPEMPSKALYRLSYAADCIEQRKGDFKVYVDGTNCLLREEKNVVREVHKYNYLYDLDCFVVEKLLPNPHQDVFGENYSYECFYAFKPGMLPPLKAVLFLINSQVLITGLAPKTEKEAIERDRVKLAEEKIKTRELLDEQYDYTEISMRLKHGAAVTDFHPKAGK